MRRVKAPTGVTPRRFAVNAFKDKLHYHGCDRCRLRYSCACAMPGTTGTCSTCRGGHVQSSWQEANQPRPCCRIESRRATDAERSSLKLAGPGPWWVCTHCWRQFPINPERITNV